MLVGDCWFLLCHRRNFGQNEHQNKEQGRKAIESNSQLSLGAGLLADGPTMYYLTAVAFAWFG